MSDVQQQIDELVKNHKVVLFMKGTRMFPQCGFSARAIEIFKRCGVTIKDVNVLSDPQIREGIKQYSNWPTIPQVYVDGKFVGGSDILLEMFENGELQKLLGVEAPKVAAPKLTITERAAEAFKSAMQEMGSEVLRFEVSPNFQYDLYFGDAQPEDFVVKTAGLDVHVAKLTAARADGSTIDYVEGPDGTGFKITNPNEPAKVKNIAPEDLKMLLDEGKPVELFDARSDQERTIARIDRAKPFDPAAVAALPKDAMIVVHCHHGVRSRGAAEQLVREGYSNVHNLTGGIDAWSVLVDPSVPRY
jgi:monothiol glutaredoxin